MAAVGCLRGSRNKDRLKLDKEKLQSVFRSKNRMYHQVLKEGDNARNFGNSRSAGRDQVNGTLKALSATFVKPTIPTLRSRKDKFVAEGSKRVKRLPEEQGTCERKSRAQRHLNEKGRELLRSRRTRNLNSRPRQLAPYHINPRQRQLAPPHKTMKMGVGTRSSCLVPATQEVCIPPSPPHLEPEVSLDLCQRERRDSNGEVEERGMPDTPISPQSCSPLPFPKIPSYPFTPPKILHDDEDSNIIYEDEVLSTPTPSPLSSIPSPTSSLASIFGASQDSCLQLPAQPLIGSKQLSASNKGSCLSTPCNNHALPSPPESIRAASSTAATPTEEEIVCRWEECRGVVSPGELLEHLQIRHVDTQKDQEKFVCQWAGCKVAGKASCSMSWLERHVITHGGLKPFRCFLPNCGASFPSQAALERHVNAHFPAEGQSANGRSNRTRGEESSGRHIRRKNKVKRRRPQCVKYGDFFDVGIMDKLRHQLLDLTEKTQLHLRGSSLHVTFQGAVKARRRDVNGKESLLLHWSPHDIPEETWVSKSQVNSSRQRSIALSHIPSSSVTHLHPAFYSPHRFRKHRRK